MFVGFTVRKLPKNSSERPKSMVWSQGQNFPYTPVGEGMVKSLLQVLPPSLVSQSGASPGGSVPGFVQLNPENAVMTISLVFVRLMAMLGSLSRNSSVLVSEGSTLLTTVSRMNTSGKVGVPNCGDLSAGFPPGLLSSPRALRVYTLPSGGQLGSNCENAGTTRNVANSKNGRHWVRTIRAGLLKIPEMAYNSACFR